MNTHARARFHDIDAEMQRISRLLHHDFPELDAAPGTDGLEVTEYRNSHDLLLGNTDMACERGGRYTPRTTPAPLPIYPERFTCNE